MGLELLGVWPGIDEADKNNFTSDLRLAIFLIVSLFMLIMPLIYALVRAWGDMMLMIDNLQLTLPVLVFYLKLIAIRWKRTAASIIMRMMYEDWMKVKSDTERNVMKRQAQTGRLIVIIGYISTTFAVICAVFLPIFGIPVRQISNITDREKPFPMPTYYFYDTDKSPQFEITLSIHCILMFVVAVGYSTVDAFLGMTIFHICGQLENFRLRLGNMALWTNFNTSLRNNIQIHLRLIRFATIIDDMFATVMLGLVLYFTITFGLYGFSLATLFSGDLPLLRKILCLIVIFIVLTYMGMYCVAGEIMATQCEEVYVAICNLEWYKLEPRNGRSLILLMMRTSESFHITAGKILPLTLDTFCSLLKTSGGYISVLLAKQS